MATETPQQEIARAAATTGARLAVAAHAVALDNHRQMLADHAQRVRDGHKAMAKAAGMEDAVGATPETSDMGNFIVTGDINVSDPTSLQKAIGALAGTPNTSTTELPISSAVSAVAEKAPAAMSTLAKVATAAALVLGGSGLGAGIPWLLGAYNKVNQTTINQTTPQIPQGLFDLEIQK